MIRALLFAACYALLASPAFGADESCFECHEKPAADGSFMPIVRAEQYAGGVHAALPCAQCHEARDGGFDVVPHDLVTQRTPECMDCHEDDFAAIAQETTRSVHAGGERPFTCSRCHDVHRMLRTPVDAPPAVRRELANGPCIDCHRDTVVEVGGREGATGVGVAHEWLPYADSHAIMRCIVCHSPVSEAGIHEVLGKDRTTRRCEQCHTDQSGLIDKFVGRDDRSSWITNPGLFEFAYVRGATRNRAVDSALIGLLLLTLAGVVAHAFGRAVLRRPESAPHVVRETVLYTLTTRLGHWINAALMLALMATGMRMHFGGREGALIGFESAFHVHNIVGAILVAVSVIFFVVHVVGGGARQYLTFREGHVRGGVAQAKWYLVGVFRGAPHPSHPSPERRFNPLQQTAYASLMWVTLPALLVSGVLLLFPATIPDEVFGVRGTWLVSTLHYLVSWAFVLFLAGHLYLITMGDRPWYGLTAMITGVHRHHEPAPAADESAADAESGADTESDCDAD